ncbi:MAG: peptidoglycan-binding protein [Desulfobulbaceae bacterium A2]|nr:MAG: peptidoglycan-binding protein [Desulfobulbaceae bacterium A2]
MFRSISGIGMRSAVALTLALVPLGGCAQMDMGSPAAKTEATGSAGGANAQNANRQLERCDSPLGTMALVEDQNADWYRTLITQWKLTSTAPVLKLLAQQSNCFVVVERGRAMDNMMQERALRESGEMRKGSNFGKGQMAAADYSLSPTIIFSNQDAGGMGAAVGGLLGPVGAAVGGSIKSKEASTLLTLVDNRSSVQLAAAEGSAKNMDIGFLGALAGGGGAGSMGGYSNTAEGKVIVAAFTDSFNGIIRAVRQYKAQEVKGGLGTGGNLKVQGGK